jgi:hypothetical protein
MTSVIKLRPCLAAPVRCDNHVKLYMYITGTHRVITFTTFVFGAVRDVIPHITPNNAPHITQAKFQIQVWT